MRNILSVLLIGAALVGGAGAADKDSAAFSFYLEYLKVSAGAEELADVMPYMPEWWRSRYEGADKEAQAGALGRIKAISGDLEKVVLEKEEAVADGVRLSMTARQKDDLPMRGEVLLVKEAGAFRVEESRWATSR